MQENAPMADDAVDATQRHCATAAKFIPLMVNVLAEADEVLVNISALFETVRCPTTDVSASRSLADRADVENSKMAKLLTKIAEEVKETPGDWPMEWASIALDDKHKNVARAEALCYASQTALRFNRELRNRARTAGAFAEAMETIARVREEKEKEGTTFSEEAAKCIVALNAVCVV